MKTEVPIVPAADSSDADDPDGSASADGEQPPEPGRTVGQAATPGPALTIDDLTAAAGESIDLEWLCARLQDAIVMLRRPVASTDITVVDDARMASLHKRHFGQHKTTDVMSFNLAVAPDAPAEAEIAICLDVAKRRSRELGHPVEHELLLYALHGLLHAVGYDDLTQGGFDEMHAEEDRILEVIGVGPLFASGAAADHGGRRAFEDRDRNDRS